MSKPNLNRWIFQIPVDDVKSVSFDTTIGDCCFLCGRRMKVRERFQIHLLTSGHLVSSDQEFSNSQGVFPIGAECKNRLPNNFIFSV